MTGDHLGSRELELYVTGALGSGARARVESHADACATCAAALTREAAFELRLYDVANQLNADRLAPVIPLPVRPSRPVRRPVSAMFSCAGAVAALMLFAGTQLRDVWTAHRAPVPAAEASGPALACFAGAGLCSEASAFGGTCRETSPPLSRLLFSPAPLSALWGDSAEASACFEGRP